MDLFEEEQQRPLPITLPEADLLFHRHMALGDEQILLQKLKTYGICERFTIRWKI